MRLLNNTIGCLVWLVIVAFGCAQQLAAQSAAEDAGRPGKAVLLGAADRAIAIVERSSAEYLKQRECFSCHHQSMSIMALMDARSRGLKVDMANLHQQVKRTLEHLKRGEADYRQGKGQGGGVDTSAYALMALAAAKVPPNETTDAVVHYLLQIHSAKKHWSVTGDRPPTQSKDISTTAGAMRSLAAYFRSVDSQAAHAPLDQLAKRVSDCDLWLAKLQPTETEERVFGSLVPSRASI